MEHIKDYDSCTICPRKCGVNRNAGQFGRCHVPAELSIARASLHMWEEPCISGKSGSGTVFFSGCSLGCVFCQNHSISNGDNGTLLTVEELADVFLKLQDMGANNINLVTPTHYVPSIIGALENAKARGLSIPVLYNSSGYERVSTLKYLDGLIDIYLPDCKYFSPDISAKYSAAPDYFDVAINALREMYRQVGKCEFVPAKDKNSAADSTDDGDAFPLMSKGMIVRHLVLPGYVEDSKIVLKKLYEEFGDNIYLSIMNQYTPLENVSAFPEINRKLTKDEYNEILDYAVSVGIENAFVQDDDTAEESFIPDFCSFNLKEFLEK